MDSGHEEPPIPRDWDQLQKAADDVSQASAGVDEGADPIRPGPLALVAATWGDLVSVLAVATTVMAALAVVGYRPDVRALPWAAAAALVWWAAAAAALVTVRQATPGMLLARVAFADTVPARRVAFVLAVAAVLWITLGVLAATGIERHLLRWASGSDVVVA